MFKLFKKEPEKIIEKVVVPCDCNYENEHCDLISQLRKYQKTEKELEKEIEMIEKDSHKLIFNFLGLLKSLENNGLKMDDYYNYLDSYHSSYVVKDTISRYSSADIFRITEELKTYKNKDDIIIEKQNILKEIQNKIKDIKDNLGIE